MCVCCKNRGYQDRAEAVFLADCLFAVNKPFCSPWASLAFDFIITRMNYGTRSLSCTHLSAVCSRRSAKSERLELFHLASVCLMGKLFCITFSGTSRDKKEGTSGEKWSEYVFVFFDLSAGGAPDPQWNRPQPGPAADPERDGAEEGEDPRFWSVWDSLQGQCVCTEAKSAGQMLAMWVSSRFSF